MTIREVGVCGVGRGERFPLLDGPFKWTVKWAPPRVWRHEAQLRSYIHYTILISKTKSIQLSIFKLTITVYAKLVSTMRAEQPELHSRPHM